MPTSDFLFEPDETRDLMGELAVVLNARDKMAVGDKLIALAELIAIYTARGPIDEAQRAEGLEMVINMIRACYTDQRADLGSMNLESHHRSHSTH